MHEQLKYFEGAAKKQIAYQFRESSDESKGTVLILSGLMETSLKYEHWIHFLNQEMKLDVLILDHRGMGFSERLLNDPMKIHMDRFEYYIKDVVTLLNLHRDQLKDRLFLLTHSTGGLIGTHLLAGNDFRFEHAVLVAPLYDVYARGIPGFAQRRLLKTLLLFFKKNSYLLGFDKSTYSKRAFETNYFTHDEQMFDMDSQILKKHPNARANGPTFNWLKEIYKGCDKLHEVIPLIRCHVDILQAKRDFYVSNRAHRKMRKYFRSSIIHSIENSFHEILMETEPVIEDVKAILRESFRTP